MAEVPQNGSTIEKPQSECIDITGLAQRILDEQPAYVLIADTHVDCDQQHLAAHLLEVLSQLPSYNQGSVGFYVEALYEHANPATGDFSGGVIRWDDFHEEMKLLRFF